MLKQIAAEPRKNDCLRLLLPERNLRTPEPTTRIDHQSRIDRSQRSISLTVRSQV